MTGIDKVKAIPPFYCEKKGGLMYNRVPYMANHRDIFLGKYVSAYIFFNKKMQKREDVFL